MNEYDNSEVSSISATVQTFWEEQNEMLDQDYEEARQEYLANYPEPLYCKGNDEHELIPGSVEGEAHAAYVREMEGR